MSKAKRPLSKAASVRARRCAQQKKADLSAVNRDGARTISPKTPGWQGGLNRKQLLCLGLLLAATFVAYLPVLKSQFTSYDDGIYILDNYLVRNLSFENVKALFSTIVWNQYSPFAMLIMAFEFKVLGASAPALKTVSVLLHLGNVLLVFQFIRKLFNRFDYALITAALFALNTLQVESVAWLSASTKIGGYVFFTLTSLLAYVSFLKNRTRAWFILSLLLFVLSCMCKEQAIALPASLLAIDYLYKRPLLTRAVILEKVPFVIVALIFAVVTFSLTGKMQNQQMVFYYTPVERLIFACLALATYLVKLILPLNLSAFYTYPLKESIPGYYYWTPPIVILLMAALYVSWKRQQRLIVFGIAFFLINLFLTLFSQILSVRDTMMADRYVYLPAVGYFLIVAYAVVELMKKKPHLRTSICAGLAVYASLLGFLTWQRARVWENSITLFTDVIAKGQLEAGKYNPFLELAYNNRGVARKQSGDRAGALADFNQAIALNPRDSNPWLNRADLHFDAGEFDAAMPDYNKALEVDPKSAHAYANRGASYGAQNKFDLALSDLNRAIELDPTLADAFGNRALLYANTKRFAEELADIDRYLRLKPNDTEMINMRALALIELNRLPEAESEFDRAIRISPSNGAFYLNRSHLYQRTGRKTQALDDAQRAQSLGVKVDPQNLNSSDLVPVATAATTPNPVNVNAPAPTPAPVVTTSPAALIPLPPEISVAPLKGANGASFKLADFFGKVMVVNLWATWCGPCRREIPELVKLHKEFHSRGVEMIGLTTENPDASAEKVRKFIQDFQIDYRIGWAPGEVAATLMQGREAIPQSFVISRDGFILHHFVGFSAANTAAQLKQALENALK